MLETRSPVSRVLSRAAIPLGRLSPGASLPATKALPDTGHRALLAVAFPHPVARFTRPTGTARLRRRGSPRGGQALPAGVCRRSPDFPRSTTFVA